MFGVAMDKSRVYVFESSPLKIAINPKVGEYICTSEGDCLKCMEDRAGELLFDLVHPTVLRDGSLLPELSENQLELFWALNRTELKINQ